MSYIWQINTQDYTEMLFNILYIFNMFVMFVLYVQ